MSKQCPDSKCYNMQHLNHHHLFRCLWHTIFGGGSDAFAHAETNRENKAFSFLILAFFSLQKAVPMQKTTDWILIHSWKIKKNFRSEMSSEWLNKNGLTISLLPIPSCRTHVKIQSVHLLPRNSRFWFVQTLNFTRAQMEEEKLKGGGTNASPYTETAVAWSLSAGKSCSTRPHSVYQCFRLLLKNTAAVKWSVGFARKFQTCSKLFGQTCS